jgi:hypothetical protein
MVFMRLVQLMPATSGTGSMSGHIAVKGGWLSWLSIQEEVQEAEQQRGCMSFRGSSWEPAGGL